MIYIVGPHLKYSGVKTIILNEISYYKFSLDLSEFDAMIITSKNSINALKKNAILPDENIKIYAISKKSAQFCKAFGFKNVFYSTKSHASEFLPEILPSLKDKKVLFLHAKEMAYDSDEILNNLKLTKLIAYENKFKPSNEIKPEKNSVIIFTAPSAVRHFLKNYGWDESYKVVAIGNTTAKELKFTKNLKISDKQTITKCISLAKNFF